jgi:DNA invertase Pin-like site-specific DNA recombinase
MFLCGQHHSGHRESLMQTVLYARVSTADQTVAHQRKQAEGAGFKVDVVVADEGVSGVSTALRERPEGRRLFDMLRRGDVLVVRWVDRLGRNYADVTQSIREFMERGVIVKTVINGMTFDGSTADPVQQAVRDALIAFMAATAQAQAEASREAQKAGIAHAKAQDGDSYRGRKPSFTRAQLETVRNRLAQGASVSAVAKETGLSRQAIYRVQSNPVEAEAALARWAA